MNVPVLLRTGCGKSPKRESQQVTVTVWKTARFQRGDCLWPCKGGMEFWVGTFFFLIMHWYSVERNSENTKKKYKKKIKITSNSTHQKKVCPPFYLYFFLTHFGWHQPHHLVHCFSHWVMHHNYSSMFRKCIFTYPVNDCGLSNTPTEPGPLLEVLDTNSHFLIL